jgi:hypothetical protein
VSDQPQGTVAAHVAHQAGTLRQGDLLSGLAVAVTGLGPAPALPDGVDEGHETAAGELWTITFAAPTGWYAICSQDCDLARGEDSEPTITIAPVVWLPQDRWREAASDSYTSRFFAIPEDALDGAPEGFAPAVDLAWQTSIAKGSLADGDLQVVHPLTGPHRRRFATWVGWRAARPPFPDDVVEAVLDPAHYVRSRLMKAYDKAVRSGAQPNLEARLIGACTGWYARMQEPNVHLLGRVTPESLTAAGFVTPDGETDAEALEGGRKKLEASIRKRMQHQQPNSGFGVAVSVRSFNDLSAADAETFSLLMR